MQILNNNGKKKVFSISYKAINVNDLIRSEIQINENDIEKTFSMIQDFFLSFQIYHE